MYPHLAKAAHFWVYECQQTKCTFKFRDGLMRLLLFNESKTVGVAVGTLKSLKFIFKQKLVL